MLNRKEYEFILGFALFGVLYNNMSSLNVVELKGHKPQDLVGKIYIWTHFC